MIRSKNNFFETSDGAILYYEDYGNGDPLILLHGFCCSSRFFQNNVEGLAKHRRVILMDLRGHGSSSKTLQGITMARFATDVKELIEHLELSGVSLMGWSMGGQVVLTYWKLFEALGYVKNIGILDSTLYPFSPDAWNMHGLKDYNMDAFALRMQKMIANPSADADAMIAGMSMKPLGEADAAWMKAELLKCPPYIAMAIYSDFVSRDFTEVLPTVTVPLLFMGSTSTAVKGILATEHYLTKCTCPTEFTRFEDGGHFFFCFEVEKFNNAILDFLIKYAQ